jgi:hypothetical protein
METEKQMIFMKYRARGWVITDYAQQTFSKGHTHIDNPRYPLLPLIDLYDYDPPKRRYDTPPSNPRVEYIGKSLETGAKTFMYCCTLQDSGEISLSPEARMTTS